MRTGRVKIYRLLPNARSVTLFLFGPGHVFGFLPFIDGGPYPAYAQAIEDVAADVMPRSVLLRLLRADAELAPRLISLLGRRLREAFNLIEGLSTPGAPRRRPVGTPRPKPAGFLVEPVDLYLHGAEQPAGVRRDHPLGEHREIERDAVAGLDQPEVCDRLARLTAQALGELVAFVFPPARVGHRNTERPPSTAMVWPVTKGAVAR